MRGRGCAAYGRAAMLLCAAGVASGSVEAQTPDPFIRPPPTQNPAPNTPAPNPAPVLPAITMAMLAQQGFEIKAMERASDRQPDFTILMQRGGEIRTCLMRIRRDSNQRPRQDSLCF